MALGARLEKADWRVFCLMGDGELHEGTVWEGLMSAAHFKLGKIQYRTKLYTEAETSFTKALEIRPDYAKAAQELAIALITVGDRNAARDTLELFVSSNPDAPEAPRMKALIQSLQ